MLEKLKNLNILYELYNSNIYDINLFEKYILINEINKEKLI